jgi:hypothetical protein
MLKVTYKTAWFMFQRRSVDLETRAPHLRGDARLVEADETYIGGWRRGTRLQKSGRRGPTRQPCSPSSSATAARAASTSTLRS